MKKTLKKYFVPHEHNNYHPHILHTKRAVFYTAFFAVLKVILIIFVIALPETVFVLPDVLAPQESKLIALANDLRADQGLPALAVNTKLQGSALLKSTDMAEKQYFSHTGPDGHSLAYYLKQVSYPYSTAGENLAMGYTDTQELFDAWVASPKHYAIIIDADFVETGVALSAGLYDNVPTVYVTEHFGAQKKSQVLTSTSTPVSSVATSTPQALAEAPVIQVEEVLSDKTTVPNKTQVVQKNNTPQNVSVTEKEVVAVESVVYNPVKSYVAWSDMSNGKMKLTVRAKISGTVKSASVNIKNYDIALAPTGKGDIYAGEVFTDEISNEFFKVILQPTIKIVSGNDEVIENAIPWLSVKIVTPATFEKYAMAKDNLGPITGIFNVSQNIYLAFLTFFVLALGLNIIWEIKKQHPHIIAQTAGMIGVLVLFYMI